MPTSRLVLRGARVFDGSGADPSAADIAIEGGRIAAVFEGTSNVASAYAATYPIALIAVVLVTQFLVTVF